MLHQTTCLLFASSLVVVELEDNHPLARCAVADDDVAEQTYLLAQIKERQTVLNGIVAHLVADLIVQIVHQPAFLNRQDLIEGTRDMETDGRYVLHQRLVLQLFAGQPSLIGTAKVELVTVLLSVYGAQDGTKFRQFNLSDARQLVEYLLLLELQLLGVGQILPLAATADTEVLAEGSRAYITILYKAYYLAFGKGVLLASDLHVAHIAGHAKRHKHHQLLPVEQALPFGCHSLYRHALKER